MGEGMAPKGVELVHTVISGAYKYAVGMEVAWRNPAKAVTSPKVTRKEVQPPEIAKVKGVLALVKREEEPLFPAMHLIAYTGLRRGEALGLRHRDINLEAGIISVVQSVGRSSKRASPLSRPRPMPGAGPWTWMMGLWPYSGATLAINRQFGWSLTGCIRTTACYSLTPLESPSTLWL